jgi:hypothetical protein
MKRTMAMTTLWIAAAAVVAGGATTALATSGGSPGADVLTQAQVRTELAKQQKPTDTVLRMGTAVVRPVGDEWAIQLKVGTVYLRCRGDQVTTFRAVGDAGYKASIERKSGSEVEAFFVRRAPKGAGVTEIVAYHAGCENGKPVQRTK